MTRLKKLNVPVSRTGLAVLAAAGMLFSAAACGGTDTMGTGGKTGTGGRTGTGGNGTGGNGTGGNGGTGGMPITKITSATAVSTDAKFAVAFDATLSKDGSITYFTGVSSNGPGVFSVPSSGGTPIVVAEGLPFAAPFGIAVSTDGKTLYVADTAATGPAEDRGRILAVPTEGGAPVPVSGSDDLAPRGIDVVQESGADQIYFTGRSKTTGAGSLFKLPAAGGTVKELATGAPMRDPEGVAVTKTGTVYILDAIGAATQLASVLVFDGTKVTEFSPDILVGYPSGIALTLDDKSIVVSSRKPQNGSSSLLFIDIFSKEPTRFPADDSFASRFEPGGIHRARNANQFAWVSYEPMGGSVFWVK